MVSIIKSIVWPIIVLTLGLFLIYTAQMFLQDVNKVNAATNRANCQLEILKNKLETDLQLCKDIFDSARR